MLLFSETSWTPGNTEEMNYRFEQECDQRLFEKKMVGLLRGLRKRLKREDLQRFESFLDAVRATEKEDYYLLVMLREAGLGVRPRRSILERLAGLVKLVLLAIAILCAILACLYILDCFGVPVTRESLAFFGWVIAIGIAAVYGTLYLTLGKPRFQILWDRIADKFKWLD
ncbi:hypothetical protein [Paludibaculum fermentans]|uniref:hypothetical protein n=1 Tax=Paludibaculum fermentans TaxID=1473598 RepID=UPI003EBC0687